MDAVQRRHKALVLLLGLLLVVGGLRQLPRALSHPTTAPLPCVPAVRLPRQPWRPPHLQCVDQDGPTSPPTGRLAVLVGDKVDVNRATVFELVSLPGIGPRMAERIVADRAENGPFFTVEALARVKGIGPRTVERLAPFLRAVSPPHEMGLEEGNENIRGRK